MEYKIVIATVTIIVAVTMDIAQGQEGDYSMPIKCFYCFGPADNSTCADPVDPREDKGKSLQVIECDSGICLKWTHYFKNVLYMHRTCSHNLKQFKIMMIDGVCRSERAGNGHLCMCGRNLCNSAPSRKLSHTLSILATLTIAAVLSSAIPFVLT